LHYHLILARDLGYGGSGDIDALIAGVTEVKRMLSSLASRIAAVPVSQFANY
jgi:hypothetical protein